MPARRIVALGAAVLVLATSFALVGATSAAACSCAVEAVEALAGADGNDDGDRADDADGADGNDGGFAGELVLVAGFLIVGTVAGVIAARLARRTGA